MANSRVALILGSSGMNNRVKESISPSLDNMDIYTYGSVSEFIDRSVSMELIFDHVLIHENMLGSERDEPVKDAESDSRVETIRELETYISEGRDETKVVLICKNTDGFRTGIDIFFNEEMGNPNTTPVIMPAIKVPVLIEFIQSPIAELKAKYYELDKDKVKVGVPTAESKDAAVGEKPKKGRKISRRGKSKPKEEAPADGTPETTTDANGNTVNGEYFGGVFRALEYYDEHNRHIPIAYDDEGNWYPLGHYNEGSATMIPIIYDAEGNPHDMGYVDEMDRYVAGAYNENGDWYATGYYDETGAWIDAADTTPPAEEEYPDQEDIGGGFSRPISNSFNEVAEVTQNTFHGFQEADNPSDGIPEVGALPGIEEGGWSVVGAGSGATGFLDKDEEEAPALPQPQGIVEEPGGFSESSWGEVNAGSGATDFLDDEGEPEQAEHAGWNVESTGFNEVPAHTQSEESIDKENAEPSPWMIPSAEESTGFDKPSEDIPSFTDILNGDDEDNTPDSHGGFVSTPSFGGFDEAPAVDTSFTAPEIPLTTGFEAAATASGLVGAAVKSVSDIKIGSHSTGVAKEARALPETTAKIVVIAGTDSQGIAYKMAKVSEGKVLLIDAEPLVNSTIEQLSSRIRFMAAKKGISSGRVFEVDGFDFLSNGIKTKLSADDVDWLSNEDNFSGYDKVIVHVGWSGLWAAQNLIRDGAVVELLIEGTENGLIEYVLEMSDRSKVNDSLAELLWLKANFSVHGHLSNALVQELRTLVVVDRLDWLKKVA